MESNVMPVSRPAVLAASPPPTRRGGYLKCAGQKARTTAGLETGTTHCCYFSTPNVNVVVECIVSPGFNSVLGKFA